MPKLNLASDDFYMSKVIEFLKQNVTEALADKINNGVFIEKDGKRILNKKDINGFDKYTYTQAEKLVTEKKGLQRVRVTNSDVYEWAIKYFDDDTVEGTLFNEDGSEYKPPKPVAAAKPATTYTPPAPKPKPQMSLFELIEEQKPENAPNVPEQKTEEVTKDTPPDEELSAEEQREILEEIAAIDIDSPAVQPQGSPFYQRYMQIQNKYPDHIIAFKRGEFYEILGKNAERFAKELSLPLSERDCGFLERVPMVGVPFHAVDNYIAKAVQKGLKIAVADSLGEVKELPKPAAEQSKGSSIYQQYMNAQSKYPDHTARPSGRAVCFLIAVYFASGASVYHKAPGLSSGRKYRLKHVLFRLVRNIFPFHPITNATAEKSIATVVRKRRYAKSFWKTLYLKIFCANSPNPIQ